MIKDRFNSAPVLNHPDLLKQFIIEAGLSGGDSANVQKPTVSRMPSFFRTCLQQKTMTYSTESYLQSK